MVDILNDALPNVAGLFREAIKTMVFSYLDFVAWLNRRLPSKLRSWRLLNWTLQGTKRYGSVLGFRIVMTKNNFRMKLDLADWLGQHIFATGEYEPSTTALIQSLLKPGNVFVDVGANAGYFSLLAAKTIGKHGRVYAFEPAPETYKELVNNIHLNQFENIKTYPIAASNYQGSIDFSIAPETHKGLSSFRTIAGSKKLTVPTMQLDNVVDFPLEIDLVKIDVEGAECRVLSGMNRIIRRCKPDFIIEISPAFLEEMGDSASLLYEMLIEHQYDPFVINGTTLDIHHSPLPNKIQYNVLFRNRERFSKA